MVVVDLWGFFLHPYLDLHFGIFYLSSLKLNQLLLMEAVVLKRSSPCCQRPRNLRKQHFTNFYDSSHCNLFTIPHSSHPSLSSSSSSSSVLHRGHFLFHPSHQIPINCHRKLDRTTTKEDRNASKRIKTSGRKGEGAPPKAAKCLVITSTDRLGPDPSELPKGIRGVLKLAPSTTTTCKYDELEKFSGSVCSRSPPPSSLPMPKFSVPQKISCNAEAGAGIDVGATNHLRCLLGI